ncbi:MAG: hypothetical protein FJX75_27195 [Armatimonadetes bacterium]|nr:hypothetical protein [Armatimonadota bacterium]
MKPTTRLTRGRRGMSFMYATVVLGAMLVLGLIFLQIGLNSAKWAYGHYRDQQALSLAEAGVDRACWMIEASPEGDSGINTQLSLTEAEAAAGIVRTFTSPTWTLGTGSYSFVAKSPHKGIYGTTEIRATGTAKGGGREEVLVVLNPQVPPPTGEDTIPAACFNYAMFSDHNLNINGSPQVLAHAESGGSGLYANGNIRFNGTAATVQGPICATGTISGSCTQIPADAGRFQGVPRVPMPEIDLNHYKSIADLKYTTSGWQSFTSGYDGSAGTYADPKIIFVDGKVKIAGQFTGVGMIVSNSEIKVTGNVTYGAPGSSWAFVTSGAFTVAGTAQIHGLIYCHNATGTAEFTGNGTPNIFGGVVADLITITGNYTTEWDGPATDIDELPGTGHRSRAPVVDTLFWERI